MQVLANLPGDVKDIIFVLLDELLPHHIVSEAAAALAAVPRAAATPGAPALAVLRGWLGALRWPLAQCSMWAAWGGRTQAGRLFSG